MQKNIFQTIEFNPLQTSTANTIDAIKQAVRDAERRARRIRAGGSKWSSTDVFVSDEAYVETHRNDALVVIGPGFSTPTSPPHIPSDRESDPTYTPPSIFRYPVHWLVDAIPGTLRRNNYYAYMGAGISIHNLYKALDRYEPPLTIPVMGSSSGQTIAGVISTGTHGGVINQPPVADGVKAIRLVIPGGKECWIESATDPLTLPGSIERIARSIGIDYVYRNDKMFAAALTSVGCLGIITALVLKVVRQFSLSERKTAVAWSAVRHALINDHIFSVEGLRQLGVELPDTRGLAIDLADLEILLNPYQKANRDREVYLVSRFSLSYVPGDRIKPPRPEPDCILLLSTLIAANSDNLDSVSNAITDLMHATRFNSGGFYRSAYLRDTFYAEYDSNADLQGVTSEICISTADNRHIQLIDSLLDEFQTVVNRHPHNIFTGFFSLRFQQHSKSLLSMQYGLEQNTARICHIEIQALRALPATAEAVLNPFRFAESGGNLHGANDYYLLLFENIAKRFEAKFHWGQLQLPNRQYIETSYSQSLYQWRQVRTLLSKEGNGRTFSNDFSTKTGLESYSEVITVCRTDAHQYDLFGYKENGTLAYLRWNGERWREPGSIPNPFSTPQQFIGPLTSASAGSGHIQLFGTGIDNHLLMYEKNDDEWTATDLTINQGREFPFNSPISACIWPGTIPKTFLFGFSTSGQIICAHNNTEDASWTIDRMDPNISGQRAYGRIQAVAINAGRIDLFARDISGVILHQWKTEDSDRWLYGNHILEGRSITTPVAVTNCGTDRMEIVGLNDFGHIIRLSNTSFGTRSGTWRKIVYSPCDRHGTFTQLSPLAQSRTTEGPDSHYEYVRVRRVNSFFGELCATSNPESQRIDIFGLGFSRDGTTQRSCYQAIFSTLNDRIEWQPNSTLFSG